MKKYDAVAVGECLIDFIPCGISPAGQPLYERNPGGAPVNVLAALAKLGKRTAFIGKVGDDPFGYYLRDALVEYGVGGQGFVFSKEAHTTLAFVHLDEKGERSFHFCRQPGADQGIVVEEVDPSLLSDTRIFHFGSISMTAEPAYSTTLQCVRQAKQHGALITYDPNWRPALWRDDRHAAATIREGLKLADVVKVSEEELAFLSGAEGIAEGAARLTEQFPITLLLVTLGEKGTYYRMGAADGRVASYQVQTVDTTGAGDGFFGAFIYKLLDAGTNPAAWSEAMLQDALRFANAGGALATTRKGAIPSFPGLPEIHELVELSVKRGAAG